jgi:hypothetical protein
MPNTNFDIHIFTQYWENYGDETNPYWKPKGGITYVVTGFTHELNDAIGRAAQQVVADVLPRIEVRNPLCTVDFIDWEFAPAGSLTPDEQLQVEYEGRVTYADKRISL